MGRKDKKPKKDRRIRIQVEKKPKAKEKPSDSLTIRWCFSTFDNYKWTEDNYKHDDFYDIAKHFKDYEGMTWASIKRRDHPISINKIIREAQTRLAEIQEEDIDALWRLGFKGLQRLWGIRDNENFRLLWWDPQHKIYPSTRKHT